MWLIISNNIIILVYFEHTKEQKMSHYRSVFNTQVHKSFGSTFSSSNSLSLKPSCSTSCSSSSVSASPLSSAATPVTNDYSTRPAIRSFGQKQTGKNLNINALKLNSFQEPTTPIDKLNTPRTVTVPTTFFPPSPIPIGEPEFTGINH